MVAATHLYIWIKKSKDYLFLPVVWESWSLGEFVGS